MHYHKIYVDPVNLIEEMVVDNEEFDHRKWSLRDADNILEKAARNIREGYERAHRAGKAISC